MLTIKVPANNELWSEKKGCFISTKATTLKMEHSLLSISKWESIWHVPFLTEEAKTDEQLLSYIKCMTINPVDDENVYYALTANNYAEIKAYLDDPLTATTIRKKPSYTRPRIVTSELMYYWMFKLRIDKSCEKWPIKRFLMLVEVFEAEDEAAYNKNKMTKSQLYSKHNAINKARRKKP